MDRIVCLPHANALVALRRGLPHCGDCRLPHRHRTELACGQRTAGGDNHEVREYEPNPKFTHDFLDYNPKNIVIFLD